MNQNLAFADYAIFIIYFIAVSSYGYTVYRKRKKEEQDAKGYFLAEGNLT
jgi:solute:Na+ symporter, SSS family